MSSPNPTPITSFPAGTVKSTDVYVAVDTTDTSSSPAGTAKKYTVGDLATVVIQELGLPNYPESYVATTTALTATYNNGSSGVNATLTNSGTQAPLTIDGKLLTTGKIVVVKDQSNHAHNGIYVVSVVGSLSTNWVLTRASYCNQVSNIIDNGTTLVSSGDTNANTYWRLDFTPPMVVGTTDIDFVPFALGNAAFKDVSDNDLSTVASVDGATTVGAVAIFADTAGTIEDSSIVLGEAAGKDVTNDALSLVVSVQNPVTVGNVAIFSDVNGSIEDGGAPDQFLLAANNLSDVASASTSRTNLGLGTAAVQDAGDFLQTANNLSDVPNPGLARANLGLGTASVENASYFLQSASNLADVTDTLVSKINLLILSGITGNIGGSGAGPITVSVPGMTADYAIVGTLKSSSNSVHVQYIESKTDEFDVTFSADPGASAILNYIATSTV